MPCHAMLKSQQRCDVHHPAPVKVRVPVLRNSLHVMQPLRRAPRSVALCSYVTLLLFS